MKSTDPRSKPVALTIAGSDSGGGAGIQADIQAFAAAGAFPTSAITAVTAQHTQGVESTHLVPSDEVCAQISAVLSDFDVAAIKTGMLGSAQIIRAVTDILAGVDRPLVVDPVMVAASGDRLLEAGAETAYTELFDQATLVTPNAREANLLTDVSIEDLQTAIRAGKELLASGTTAALIKGGHISGDPIYDVLVTEDQTLVFEHERVRTPTTHGSGCTLAASVAGRLATGRSLSEAVKESIEYLDRSIQHHYAVGEGGAVNHRVDDERSNDGSPSVVIRSEEELPTDSGGF